MMVWSSVTPARGSRPGAATTRVMSAIVAMNACSTSSAWRGRERRERAEAAQRAVDRDGRQSTTTAEAASRRPKRYAAQSSGGIARNASGYWRERGGSEPAAQISARAPTTTSSSAPSSIGSGAPGPGSAAPRGPQDDGRRHEQRARHVAQGPRDPDRADVGPRRVAGEHEARDADRGADRGAPAATAVANAKMSRGRSNARRPPAQPLDEPGAEQGLERVAERDAERGGHRARGGHVDHEGPDRHRRPRPAAQEQERGEGDPGGRPHRGGARVDGGEEQAELAGQDVDGRRARPARPTAADPEVRIRRSPSTIRGSVRRTRRRGECCRPRPAGRRRWWPPARRGRSC